MKKIDVGHKIRVKETGQEGFIESIQDGNYRIKDFANGGVIKYTVEFKVPNGQPSSTSVTASSETEAAENLKSWIPNAEIIKVYEKNSFAESDIESAEKFQIVSPRGYFSRSMQTGKPIFLRSYQMGYTYPKAEAEKILELLKKDLNTEDLQVVPFGSVEFDDDFADGGETEGAEATTETVKEEDLELVDSGGGSGGGGSQQPQQPQMPYIDLNDIYERLDMIKNYKFRVPQFAFNTFKEKRFKYIRDIFRAIIAQRYHKVNSELVFTEQKLNSFFKFANNYKAFSNIISFGIDSDYKYDKKHFIAYYVITNNIKWLFSLSIEEAEKIIPFLQNQDLFDGTITYNDMNLLPNVVEKYNDNLGGYPPETQFILIYQSIIFLLDEMENIIVNDKSYEKILLLSMVSQPKLFSYDDFLNEHLDYFLKSLNVLHTSLINKEYFYDMYSSSKMDEVMLSEIMDSYTNGVLNTINIIKKEDGYVFYYCDNLRSNLIDSMIKITRKKDLSIEEKLLILDIISTFYLTFEQKNQENILQNLEFLFNLQQEYYEDEIRRQEINYKIKSLI